MHIRADPPCLICVMISLSTVNCAELPVVTGEITMRAFHIFKPFYRARLSALIIAGAAILLSGVGRPADSAQAQTATPANVVLNCNPNQVVATRFSFHITFCKPTAEPMTFTEDPENSQAALNQLNGLAYINIKATRPGAKPGIGSLVYQAGSIAQYRQDTQRVESFKFDQVVNEGPTGTFWGQSIVGLALTTPPIDANSPVISSVEWDVEYSGQLWTFVMAWDVNLPNATEWETASQHFVVGTDYLPSRSTGSIGLSITGDTSTANQLSTSDLTLRPVATPSWWNGICDDNNYFPVAGIHAIALGGSWNNLLACGPRPYTVSNPDNMAHFFAHAWGEYEFECTELVMRWLYSEWNIAPFQGNGNTLKDHLPSSVLFYPNGTPNIVPGDVLTENGSTKNAFGHTAVITAVSLDQTGSGTLTILEQNSSAAGTRLLYVNRWLVNPDGLNVYQQTIQGWIHVPGNESVNTPTPTPTLAVSSTITPTPTHTPTATNTLTPSPTLTLIAPLHDTIGIYRDGTFYLRLSNSTGFSDLTVNFNTGNQTYPVVGDWTGTGFDNVGLFDQAGGVFSLCRFNNSLACVNSANIISATFGSPGDQPVAGRWLPSMTTDGLGIFRAANSLFAFKNVLSTGFADETAIFGMPGDIGLMGDWTGQGYDTPGLYRPATAAFLLSNQIVRPVSVPISAPDIALTYGNAGDSPIVGDWIGQGHFGVGLFRPTNGYTYLRNTLTTGYSDIAFTYGNAGDVPVAGRWSTISP